MTLTLFLNSLLLGSGLQSKDSTQIKSQLFILQASRTKQMTELDSLNLSWFSQISINPGSLKYEYQVEKICISEDIESLIAFGVTL